MYSGSTFRIKSGRVMGVHQRIDRVARRQLGKFLPSEIEFPDYKRIVHFEGLNGPDGIKRKSPAKDEPWHYIEPNNPENSQLLDIIEGHLANMASAIRENNQERIAFEAAWMAHAITDGLTPAHHYPLEEKLQELRGGLSIETRTSTRDKLILPGDSLPKAIRNNWEYWGAKGVMTTHLAFELGVSLAISGSRLRTHQLSPQDIGRLKRIGYRQEFIRTLAYIDELNMYKKFTSDGWSRDLAYKTRAELVPLIVRAVALGWCEALLMADKELEINA